MSHAYSVTVTLFYELANLFFWPVAVALIVLFVIALIDLGRLCAQLWRRRREPPTDLLALARHIAGSADALREPPPADLALSRSLRRFWHLVDGRLRHAPDDAPVDLWLEEVLQQEEIAATSGLDRTRALVRLGPMLGLAGTIIPLGPALQALLGGNMADMVSHLVVGFGAVVCGLVLSGIAYAITLVRERWVRVELKEMENLCELLMRARQRASERPDRLELVHA